MDRSRGEFPVGGLGDETGMRYGGQSPPEADDILGLKVYFI